MTTLRDIMTRDLTTAKPGSTVQDVARLMAEEDIGNVLIMEGGELRGIVTDRDIVVRCLAAGKDASCRVEEIATADVFTMSGDADVHEAGREMAERQLRRLPVTEGGEVVGIVSLGDLAVRADTDADAKALEGISQSG